MEVGSVGLASNADVLRAGHTIQSCGGARDDPKECLRWRLLEGLSAKRIYVNFMLVSKFNLFGRKVQRIP